MPKQKPKLGQNFLTDETACLRIADALGDITQRTVVEIGPGHGAITSILAARCAHLHCIEFDPALARELTFKFRANPRVTIHHADILQFNLAQLQTENCKLKTENQNPTTNPDQLAADSSQLGAECTTPEPATLDVIGNLPYYVTSDILLHLYAAARANLIRRAVLMMQREVADRITAAPGVSDYGALSAFTQLHAHAAPLFTLPPSAFSPPPDVYSTVVRLDFAPRFAELHVDPEGFNRFLRAGFAQKRKTLSNNLRAAGFTPAQLQHAWPHDLPAQVRAEAVSLESLAELYRSLELGSYPAGTGAPAS
ncbi:MAG TPA: 16S rRNA (adenine(1518)-N(6)/adenine(1519)-N(6))-dimethyltransferase RsmA [Acidobacteriaceae bacterium]|nr:16S rRNA (adenine(1518)-N(6)/adenine(1519)-N(6))-dimethyltransferase RsmA [Acidobacteriaceae bacterium]